jgi:hydrogenase nickel incorporation protein HypA/HybF
MHEYSLARSLVHTIEDIAVQQGALGVVAAQVRLSPFSCMSADGLRENFNQAAKGTRAEGALLKVHVPLSETGEELGIGQGVVLESIELKVELTATL